MTKKLVLKCMLRIRHRMSAIYGHGFAQRTLTWLAGSEEQNTLLTAGLTYTKERNTL